MKKVFTIMFFCLTTLFVNSQTDIKVCTFNIRNSGEDDGVNSWTNRKPIISAFLKREQQDIICFQEVLTNQLEFLVSNLKNYSYYGVGRNDGKTKGEYAPVFFSKTRFTLLTSKTIWLSSTPSVEGSVGWDAATQRIATFAMLFDRENNMNILIVNTHLDHIGTTARAEEVKLILKTIKQYNSTGKTIFTGDFNSTPDEEAYKIAIGSWKNIQRLYDSREKATKKLMGNKQSFTGYGTQKGEYIIDHIFYDYNFKATRYEINEVQENDVYISDHYPVTAVLTVAYDLPKDDYGIQELNPQLASPYLRDNTVLFNDKKKITVDCDASEAQIFYTLDESEPTTKGKLYTKPFFIDKSCTLKLKAFSKDNNSSETSSYSFYKAIFNNDTKKSLTIHLNSEPSHKYNYNPASLCDGKIAESGSFENWMGFDGSDLDVVLVNNDNAIIKSVQLRFLINTKLWIFPPDSIIISVSNDGVNYVNIKNENINHTISKNDNESILVSSTPLNKKVKYIKIYAKNYGILPDWHKGKGSPAWLFTDEIILDQE